MHSWTPLVSSYQGMREYALNLYWSMKFEKVRCVSVVYEIYDQIRFWYRNIIENPTSVVFEIYDQIPFWYRNIIENPTSTGNNKQRGGPVFVSSIAHDMIQISAAGRLGRTEATIALLFSRKSNGREHRCFHSLPGLCSVSFYSTKICMKFLWCHPIPWTILVLALPTSTDMSSVPRNQLWHKIHGELWRLI